MGDKGKMGVIVKIIEERNWCIVEGLNTEYEYDENRPPRKKTKPLLTTTQIKLVDPVDERGCDVEWRYTEDGDRVRVSTRSGREEVYKAAKEENWGYEMEVEERERVDGRGRG